MYFRFHSCLMVVNILVLHPTMLIFLFKTRNTMHNGILWGYVFTEVWCGVIGKSVIMVYQAGLIIYDWCFFLVGISFVFPFSAIHFGGPLHSFDVSVQMVITLLCVQNSLAIDNSRDWSRHWDSLFLRSTGQYASEYYRRVESSVETSYKVRHNAQSSYS